MFHKPRIKTSNKRQSINVQASDSETSRKQGDKSDGDKSVVTSEVASNTRDGATKRLIDILGEDDSEAETKEKVKDIVTLQNHRKKSRGMSALPVTEDDANVEEEVLEEEQYGLLERQFKSQVGGGLQNDQNDKHLEAFLRSRMGEKQSQEPQPLDEHERNVQSLFEVPESLHVEDTSQQYLNKTPWQTGLAEVSLPVSVKLENIERTEKAKRDILQMKRFGDLTQGDNNYRGYAPRFQSWEEKKAQSSTPSDEAAVERFRRRTIASMRK